MYDGFHKAYNIHALNTIRKRVDFPDHQLAVESDEQHAPVNGAVRYPQIFKPTIDVSIALKGHENAQIDLQSEPLTMESFGKEFWIGNPTEGV